MNNNTLITNTKQSSGKPTPYIASAKMEVGVGAIVLAIIGRAIKGATGQLVNSTPKIPGKSPLPEADPKSSIDKRSLQYP